MARTNLFVPRSIILYSLLLALTAHAGDGRYLGAADSEFETLAQANEPVWFKVGPSEPEPESHETFLVPISDPDRIEQARVLADSGPGHGVGSIVVALISPGSDGLNRDLDAPGQPLWDWHVVEVQDFADNAIEICDGWPGFIDEDPKAFVLNTANRICLWTYTVLEEVEAPQYGIHPGLSGSWYDPSRAGQGMFISIDRDLPLIFVGWFTYDQQGTHGLTGQRWFTAQGPYTADSAELELFVTTAGRFDEPDPVMRTAPGEVGQLELGFSDCNRGTVTYRFVGGSERTFEISRLPHVDRC